ncbi:MAG: 7-dehydrocholesterol reductase, partial [Parachlamydiaceae bacterium]
INFSFASQQYALYGYVTNSMILVNFFQLLYVVYFFWKEAWYLKTIDIHHDHFGWMLSWGDLVWLPYMYTLQALYLVFNPVELSTPYLLFVLALGLLGFYIFASSNNQKDQFRKNPEKLIWGEKPKSLSCTYQTLDGKTRESKLLLSGWWGIGRHMNYTGDLMLSLAYSLACGTLNPFPYFYFFFLTTLLVHRTLRDEERMKEKYGKTWNEYTKHVPYRMIPYVW